MPAKSTKKPVRKAHRYRGSFLHRGKWWVAWCDEVPGALTQGRTLDEARENLRDAMLLMLEPLDVATLPEAETQLLHEDIVL